MAAAVDICNRALMRIGASRITALADVSKEAEHCEAFYEPVRDEILAGHNWNFAIKRAKLAQLVATPSFEWDYAFTLPTDFLRAVSVHDNDGGVGAVPYKIEGEPDDARRLVSSAEDIYLRYVSQVTDVNQMPAEFREMLSYRIAADLAVPIAASNTLADRMTQFYIRAERRAKSIDAMQDYPEALPDSDWVTARY
ncbi:MAG: hypothetical protein GY953_39315 [bacterium]|nr:hypothetical protein [bacterium]